MFYFFRNCNRYLTVKLFLTSLKCTWSRTPCMSSRTPLTFSLLQSRKTVLPLLVCRVGPPVHRVGPPVHRVEPLPFLLVLTALEHEVASVRMRFEIRRTLLLVCQRNNGQTAIIPLQIPKTRLDPWLTFMVRLVEGTPYNYRL